jgi:hypothetical protein
VLAYVGKTSDGRYEPFYFGTSPDSVELNDDLFIIIRETAEAYENARQQQSSEIEKPAAIIDRMPDLDKATLDATGKAPVETNPNGVPQSTLTMAPLTASKSIRWTGDVPALKWTSFYTKVLSRFARDTGVELHLRATFEVKGDLPLHKVDETRAALQELGVSQEVEWD